MCLVVTLVSIATAFLIFPNAFIRLWESLVDLWHSFLYYLGQLLYMFMIQTAIIGALYNIDTFSQTGVEQSKNYTYALMGRIGYEESARILKEEMEQ